MVNLRSADITRGETQKHVNYNILQYCADKFSKESYFKALDLPCGSMNFLNYMRRLFPKADLYGADLKTPSHHDNFRFIKMDLAKDLITPEEEKFDLITSISGVMMFGNTLNFISNCAARLKKDGIFIVTNDNAATIKDKISFLLLGHYRIFKAIYEDSEEMTQNVPIQELCRLLRINGLTIEEIKYTSAYGKDLIYLPIALLAYPIQWLYLRRLKTTLPAPLKQQMFPFKYCFCRHYIIVSRNA